MFNSFCNFKNDIPAATYEVWALGYKDDKYTDAEMYIKTFDNPNDAVHFAEKLTLADIVDLAAKNNFGLDKIPSTPSQIFLEVETVIQISDEAHEDDYFENINTIFRKIFL